MGGELTESESLWDCGLIPGRELGSLLSLDILPNCSAALHCKNTRLTWLITGNRYVLIPKLDIKRRTLTGMLC